MPKKKWRLTPQPQDKVPAPKLPYLPQDPKRYQPGIALIGCGAITPHHLGEYKKAGYRVLAVADVVRKRARKRQTDFFPRAEVYTDYTRVLERDDIEVVDIAPHPKERYPIIEAALNAGKHVLSQKPFVLDLDRGEHLVHLARRNGVKLAVNQNGRWAPHFSYMRQAIQAGLIGDIISVHTQNHWDHNWTADTPFNEVRHLMLYDFAIHWFDILACWMGGRKPERVFASLAKGANQVADPPLLAQVMVEYEQAQASLVFDGSTPFALPERAVVTGSKGTLVGEKERRVTLRTANGVARPRLRGRWFTNGFHGTMGELLRAIEEDREPSNSGADNLKGLALCYAAVASAEQHKPMVPGEVRRMPGA